MGILRQISPAFPFFGNIFSSTSAASLLPQRSLLLGGPDENCFTSQKRLPSTLKLRFGWVTSFLSGFRWEEWHVKTQTKGCLSSQWIICWAHRGSHFTTVTSPGFKNNVVKEKSETDTNVCFPKCQHGCTLSPSPVPPASFPNLALQRCA